MVRGGSDSSSSSSGESLGKLRRLKKMLESSSSSGSSSEVEDRPVRSSSKAKAKAQSATAARGNPPQRAGATAERRPGSTSTRPSATASQSVRSSHGGSGSSQKDVQQSLASSRRPDKNVGNSRSKTDLALSPPTSSQPFKVTAAPEDSDSDSSSKPSRRRGQKKQSSRKARDRSSSSSEPNPPPKKQPAEEKSRATEPRRTPEPSKKTQKFDPPPRSDSDISDANDVGQKGPSNATRASTGSRIDDRKGQRSSSSATKEASGPPTESAKDQFADLQVGAVLEAMEDLVIFMDRNTRQVKIARGDQARITNKKKDFVWAELLASNEKVYIAQGKVKCFREVKEEEPETASMSQPLPPNGSNKYTLQTETLVYDDDDNDVVHNKQPPQSSLTHIPGAWVNLLQLKHHLDQMTATLEQIVGKKVMFVMGNTGVGKSTAMQWFAGNTFKKTKYNNRDVWEVDGKAHSDFQIGHQSKSETKCIKHLKIQSARMEGEEMFYLDSAGFGDTSGVEVDIATSMSVKRVAEVCSALRMLVMVNCASFCTDRGHGVRDLMKLISSFAQDWKRHRFAFTFLFTHKEFLRPGAEDHGTKEGRQRDTEMLCNWLNELAAKTHIDKGARQYAPAGSSVKEVLEWIAKCLSNGWVHLATIFHPEDRKPHRLRREIERFESEPDQKRPGERRYYALGLAPNEPCSKVIHCGLKEETKNKILLELDSSAERVERFLQSNELQKVFDMLEILNAVRKQLQEVPKADQKFGAVQQTVTGYVEKLLSRPTDIVIKGTAKSLSSSMERLSLGDASLVFRNISLARKVSETFVLAGWSGPVGMGADKVVERLKAGLMENLEELRKSSIKVRAMDTLADQEARLCQPISGGILYMLECLLLWGEAARQARQESGEAAAYLQDIHDLGKQGMSVLQRYIEDLRTFLKTVKDDKMKERIAAVAHQCQICHWLKQLPNELKVVDVDELEDNSKGKQRTLEEQVNALAFDAVDAISECIEKMREFPEADVGSICGKPSIQEAFEVIHQRISKLLECGEHLELEKENLHSLVEIYHRGENSVEQEAERARTELKDVVDKALNALQDDAPLPLRAVDGMKAIRKLADSIGTPTGKSLRARTACEASLVQVCKTVDEHITKCRAKLDFLWKQGQPSLGCFDVESITQQAALLAVIVPLAWRDDIHREDDVPSVKSMIEGLQKRYMEYIIADSKKVATLVETFLRAPSSLTKIDELANTFTERQQLNALAVCLPQTDQDSQVLEANLRELVASWKESQLQHPFDPASTTLAKVLRAASPFAKELEEFFLVWEVFGKMPGHRAMISAAKQEADARLEWLKKSMEELMSKDGEFQDKKQLLDFLTSWSGKNGEKKDTQTLKLANICEKLPKLETLLDKLREKIATESQRIGDLIQESPDLDAASAAVQAFKEAECLDAKNYLNGFVAIEVEKLTARLESKRLVFGEALEKHIEACDFEEIQGQISSIATSATLKEKAEGLFQQIAARIQREYKDADTNIQDGAKVAVCMGLLKRASHSLDPFASRLREVDFQLCLKSLQKRINNTFEEILSEFKSALSSSKLPDILKQQSKLLNYHSATKGWLSESLCATAAETLATAGKCLDSVPLLVKAFGENLKADPDDRTDTTELIGKLGELKLINRRETLTESSGSLAAALTLNGISKLYDKSKLELSTILDAVHRECPLTSQKNLQFEAARARSVYKYVLDECEKGLREHIDIKFNIKALWEKAKRLHQQTWEGLEKDIISLRQLEQRWVPILEQWGTAMRTVDHMKSYFYSRDSEFGRVMKKFALQARAMQRAAIAALNDHNYRGLGLHCEVVFRMEELLHFHHKQTAEEFAPMMQALRDQLMEHNSTLCKNLCQSIELESTHQFEMLFLRQYKFVKALKASYPELLTSLPAMHMQIASHLQQKLDELPKPLEQYDLPMFAQRVEVLRKLGVVLPKILPLYTPLVNAKDDSGLQQLEKIWRKHFSARVLDETGRFYTILEVPADACDEDIRRQYHALSLVFHPDKNLEQGPEGADQKLLNAAKEALLGETARHRRSSEWQKAVQEFFATMIRDIPVKMRKGMEENLEEGDYKAAKQILFAVRDLPKIANLVDPTLPVETAGPEIREVAKVHLNKLGGDVMRSWKDGDIKKLGKIVDRLQKVDDSFAGLRDLYSEEWNVDLRKEVTAGIEAKCMSTFEMMGDQSNLGQDVWQTETIATDILYLARIMDEIPLFKDQAFKSIDRILDFCQAEVSPNFVFKLGMLFEQGKVGNKDSNGNVEEEDKTTSKNILSAFRQFKDIHTVIWNQQTSKVERELGALLSEIKPYKVPSSGPQVPLTPDRGCLQQGVEKYNKAYDKRLLLWKSNEFVLTQLVDEAKQLCGQCSAKVDSWSQQVRDILPELLACIGVYFTISKSGASYEMLSKRSEGEQIAMPGVESVEADSVLQRPHTIQILTLLCLLGYDSNATSLQRQLMQIRTGEGKSMILGISSLVFALLGFRVRCVCYSEYLSNRDYKLFKGLFEAFGVEQHVVYSKITKFSEDKIAERGDIRELTQDLLMGNLAPGSTTFALEEHRQEILLLDEVDMFFGADFYPETYNQVATIESKEARDLLREVWANREKPSGQLFRDTRRSAPCKSLEKQMPHFSFVIDREVRQMCSDVKKFNETPYVVDSKKNRIGYKEMDGVSYQVVHGYKTAFAYLHEASNASFSDNKEDGAALTHGLRFRVSCGQFLYNKIEPACIMGVSGTLAALGADEWNIMAKYDIDCYTMMPSVYGSSQFKFFDADKGPSPLTVTKTRDEQFRVITEQVKEIQREKRGVVVLFENTEILNKFTETKYNKEIQNKNKLSENMEDSEKEFFIKKAATSGQATFTTAIFGRGTDFMCNDRRVLQAGGVHIIQAFMSMDKSEEVQIQGRTARQGEKGTFGMVLCQEDITKDFGLQESDLQNLPGREKYDKLDRQREARRHTKFQTIHERLEDAKVRDRMSRDFFGTVAVGDTANATIKFQALIEKIAPRCGSDPNHVVFCLDDSGSMYGKPWKALQNAFQVFLIARQGTEDLISVVVFNSSPTVAMQLVDVPTAQSTPLRFAGGGTNFPPAIQKAEQVLKAGLNQGQSSKPVLVFMSDGVGGDGRAEMRHLLQEFPDLQCHTVFFGTSNGAAHLRLLADAAAGHFHNSVDGIALQETFKEIATKPEYTR